MANKYIMLHDMWEHRQAAAGADEQDVNCFTGLPARPLSPASSQSSSRLGDGEEPCNYGIPPIRADALRLKLSRLLPKPASRIPPENTLHVLPPSNSMSWHESDD
jgi:hypothetical protein